jgi:hypothetical protein
LGEEGGGAEGEACLVEEGSSFNEILIGVEHGEQ